MSVSMDSSATTLMTDDSSGPDPTGQSSKRYADLDDGLTPHVTPAAGRNDTTNNDSPSQREEDEWLMSCRCDDGKMLVSLLSCLQHVSESPVDSQQAATSTTQSSSRRFSRKNKTIQPVTIFCSPTGFTFHVFGPAKQSEASCELQKAMFSEYQVMQDDDNQEDWQAGGEFCVNLTSVLDSLQLLGPLDNRTNVVLSYNLNTEVFRVELLQDGEQGVLCTTAIQSIMAPADDPDGNSLSNAFRSSPVAARMMVRSGILREILPEWSSVAGASCASVAISAKRGLEIAVLGSFGECWVQVPPIGDHLSQPLECQKTVTRTYPLHSLLSSMKGLDIAEETCININTDGIMAIQHKTVDPTGQGCSSYVDFIMTCLEDDDEDEEDHEDETAAAGEDASTRASPSQRSIRSRNSPSQPSPATTTTGTTIRRRRRNQRASPSQSTTRTRNSNRTGEDVEQGSSDTENEEDTPTARQKRQAMQKRKQGLEESDSSSEEETHPMISAAPLFGSVVHEKPSSTSETPPRRRQRRSTSQAPIQRQQSKGKKKKSIGDEDHSDGSVNMLLAKNDDTEDDASTEEEEMATTPRPRHHNRDGNCSSPEIVYGKQH